MARTIGNPLEVDWLVRLRWAAIAAQIGSIAGVRFLLHAPFPLWPLVAIIGATVGLNIGLWIWLRRGHSLSQPAIAIHLLFDIAALTGLLVWTGGAMNPFTTLYVLQVALAAILVSRTWSLVVAAGAVIAFGGLLLARPEAIHVWHSGSMFMLHVRGMWVAFALTAGALWFFVERTTRALRHREELLAARHLEAERAAHVASLATLAAGAAHELNTPIGTVAVLAAELSDILAKDPAARDYAERIRTEVRRCSEILNKLRPNDPQAVEREVVSVAKWVRDSVADWSDENDFPKVRVSVSDDAEPLHVRIQPDLLERTLDNLLDNALHATGDPKAIEVRVDRAEKNADTVRITVIDQGKGIPAEDLPRLGEPFFTTREPGQGMGLGLFLAHATIAQHDGKLRIQSRPGLTEVECVLPVFREAAIS